MSPVVAWKITEETEESRNRWKQQQAKAKIDEMRWRALRQEMIKKGKPDWLL